MAGDRRSESNPFSDNAAIQDEREAMVESTLSVGRNATLTLGTDAVIVLGNSLKSGFCVSDQLTCFYADDGLRGDSGFDCFGLFKSE